MLIETGRVVAVEEDSVWVETIRRTTCGTCAAQKGCGHGLINSMSSGRRSLIRVLPGDVDITQCRVDDEVSLSIPEEVILRGSFIVYMLPVAFMLVGTILGSEVSSSTDIGSAVGAVAGLFAGLATVKWHAQRHRDDDTLQPTLVAVERHAAAPVTVA